MFEAQVSHKIESSHGPKFLKLERFQRLNRKVSEKGQVSYKNNIPSLQTPTNKFPVVGKIPEFGRRDARVQPRRRRFSRGAVALDLPEEEVEVRPA